MSTPVRYDVVDRIAILTIDNPPVNALSPAVWEALDEAVARAAADPGVEAMVLIGAGSTFIAGADINVFATLKTREQSLTRSASTHALLKRLEDCPKPLIAAIDDEDPMVAGRALHALACDKCKQGACRPGEDAWVPRAITRLGHPNPDLRAAAIDALGKVADHRPDVAAALADASQADSDKGLRGMARRRIGA